MYPLTVCLCDSFIQSINHSHAEGTKLKVYPSEGKDSSKGIAAHQKMYFVMQALKAALPHVIVQGIPTVSRAVINEETDASGTCSWIVIYHYHYYSDIKLLQPSCSIFYFSLNHDI